MLDISYELAGPDIVFERFDGDLVVLNLSTGKYFGLNLVAAVLWDALMTGAPAADLVAAGANAADLQAFLAELAKQGLIKTAAMPRIATLQPETAAALAAALAALAGAPQIEIFDDLADLILADPIHDVDAQTGWPHLPNAAP